MAGIYPAALHLFFTILTATTDLSSFYLDIENKITKKYEMMDGSFVSRLDQTQSELNYKEFLHFLTLTDSKGTHFTFIFRIYDLYLVGHQINDDPFYVIKSRDLPRTRECLKLHGFGKARLINLRDDYVELESKSYIMRKELPIGLNGLTTALNTLNVPDPGANIPGTAFAYLFMSRFIAEAIRCSDIRDFISNNFMSNEGKGSAIPPELLQYEYGWANCSEIMEHGIDDFQVEDFAGPVSWEDMVQRYPVIKQTTQKQDIGSLNMYDEYIKIVAKVSELIENKMKVVRRSEEVGMKEWEEQKRKERRARESGARGWSRERARGKDRHQRWSRSREERNREQGHARAQAYARARARP